MQLFTKAWHGDHWIVDLDNVHWVPVTACINLSLDLIVHLSPYLCELVQLCQLARMLWSVVSIIYWAAMKVMHVLKSNLQAPAIWNQLLISLSKRFSTWLENILLETVVCSLTVLFPPCMHRFVPDLWYITNCIMIRVTVACHATFSIGFLAGPSAAVIHFLSFRSQIWIASLNNVIIRLINTWLLHRSSDQWINNWPSVEFVNSPYWLINNSVSSISVLQWTGSSLECLFGR